MAELETQETEASVQDFMNGVSNEKKQADSFAKLKPMRDVTGEEPAMWLPSIVGFGRYR